MSRPYPLKVLKAKEAASELTPPMVVITYDEKGEVEKTEEIRANAQLDKSFPLNPWKMPFVNSEIRRSIKSNTHIQLDTSCSLVAIEKFTLTPLSIDANLLSDLIATNVDTEIRRHLIKLSVRSDTLRISAKADVNIIRLLKDCLMDHEAVEVLYQVSFADPLYPNPSVIRQLSNCKTLEEASSILKDNPYPANYTKTKQKIQEIGSTYLEHVQKKHRTPKIITFKEFHGSESYPCSFDQLQELINEVGADCVKIRIFGIFPWEI